MTAFIQFEALLNLPHLFNSPRKLPFSFWMLLLSLLPFYCLSPV